MEIDDKLAIDRRSVRPPETLRNVPYADQHASNASISALASDMHLIRY